MWIAISTCVTTATDAASNHYQFFPPFLLRTDLDLETVLWLQNYLIKTFKGTLCIVSHDRYFLNEVVTDVCHFHKSSLTTYRGDINNFTAVLEENKNRQMRLYEQQEAKRDHLQKCKFHLFSCSYNIGYIVSTNCI